MAADPDLLLWNPLRGVVDLPSAEHRCLEAGDWTGGTYASFSILDATSRRYVGNVTLYGIEDVFASIGYRIAPWARGAGAATTAVRAITGWGFGALNLVRISLYHAVENEASCRVAHKTGFALEGELRSSQRCGDGKIHDEHLHARLNPSQP